MIYQSEKNPNSHLTIKERKWPSFPTKQLLSRRLIRGKVLDFGCGLGIDVKFLKTKNIDVTGYDPYYAPDYPTEKYDTIVCNYVLNILLPEEQAHVLMAISELLKPIGKAYFTVRRDIKYNGFRTHIKHKRKVYQCNVILPYKTIIKTEHCEIYEYEHINQQTEDFQNGCPFCYPTPDRELITESATAYTILDKYPVSKGHTLIIPKKHIAEYFDLPERVKTACWLMVDRVKWFTDKQFQPDGYNVGINIGRVSGQTIPHVHIHLIPRYKGDVENPTGGIRNVIPDKGNYLALIKEH